MQFTQLEASIASMRGIKVVLSKVVSLFGARDKNGECPSNVMFVASNYTVILLCSFLEEWERFQALGKEDEAVRNTCKVLKPLIERIRKVYPDLRQFRSLLLAHSPREGNGQPHLPWDVHLNLEVPTAYAEHLLLGNLCLVCIAEVAWRHTEAAQSASEKAKASMEKAPVAERGVRTLDEMRDELQRVMKQAGLDLTRHGIPMTG